MAISVDERADSAKMAGELNIPFPLLEDTGLKTALAYGVAMDGEDIAVPAVFVIDQGKRIHWKKVGESLWDRPSVRDILDRVADAR